MKIFGVWNIIRHSLIIWNTHCVCVDSAFLLSKNAVLDEINKDYREKFGKINDKLQNLLKYAQVEE